MYDYVDKPIASTPAAEQGCELMEPPGVLGHIILQTSSGPYGQPAYTVDVGRYQVCSSLHPSTVYFFTCFI